MRSGGYTLIELLIVLVIISVIGVVSFVNYRQFALNQITGTAMDQIQTVLRLAQANASSSTLCNNQAAISWSVRITNPSTLELLCKPKDDPTRDYLSKTFSLEDVQIGPIRGGSSCPSDASFPFSLNYSTNVLTFSYPNASSDCLNSATWTVTITNMKNNSPKIFKISRGGAIDVQ